MDIDERLAALTTNLELLTVNTHALQDQMRIHEAKWERMRRVVNAALAAGFAEEGEEPEDPRT